MVPALSGLFLAALCGQGAYAFQEATKYLIVSSPATHQVGYTLLKRNGDFDTVNMRLLIGSGLVYPQGLAVDNIRQRLYIADPQLNALVAYKLVMNGDAVEAQNQEVVVNGIETRWVAVDALGNVFFSDEVNSRIYKISAQEMDTKKDQAQKNAMVVYDQGNVGPAVSLPGGVAVDNFHVYWTNKENGEQIGVLHYGNEDSAASSATLLAKNSPKCYGVCLGINTVFFTDETQNLFAQRRGQADISTVSDHFEAPRGCAHDGEGTIYVADKNKNAVFSIPTNTPNSLDNLPVSLTVNMQGAYGVAIFAHIDAAASLTYSAILLTAIVVSLTL